MVLTFEEPPLEVLVLGGELHLLQAPQVEHLVGGLGFCMHRALQQKGLGPLDLCALLNEIMSKGPTPHLTPVSKI